MRGSKHHYLFVTALVTAGIVGVANDAWGQVAQTAKKPQTLAKKSQTLPVITVTAQKVRQREIDVPVALTEVKANALLKQNLVQITDYYSRIPGLQVGGSPANSGGISALSLRGITSGLNGNPTIAVLIDGIPFGATTANGAPPFPDLDPGILSRIEVLRGPQGTLYGASSLGGLIDFFTKTPDLNAYTADVSAGSSTVSGGNTGWSERANANIPIIANHVALMVSGTYRNDPEWIDLDNTLNNQRENNVNQVITRSGNAKLLIKPSDNLSITLSALAQHLTSQNTSEITVCPQCATTQTAITNYIPLYGPNTIKGSPSNRITTFELYSAKLVYNLGWAQLTSLSGWNHTQWMDTGDITPIFGFLLPLYNAPGGRVTIGNENYSSRFTEEIRLHHSGEHIDWLAGVYYNHELENIAQTLNVFNSTDNPVSQPYDGTGPFYYTERALFGDVTFHITPKFDFQVGVRASSIDEAYYSHTTIVGPASAIFGPTSTLPRNTTSSRPVTWLATPSYHITRNLMAYFRAASGYRPGGPNTDVPSIPKTYAPDTVTSYELGLKGLVAGNHSLKFDAALFQIDWKNLQLLDTDAVSQFNFFTNGSAARSRGIELSVTWMPWQGFTVGSNLTYTDARLTKNLPPATPTIVPLFGVAGEELPFTSKYAGNLNLQQNFHLTGDLYGYVGADYSYVGNRLSEFRTNSPSAPRPRFNLPGYSLFDVDAGLILGDTWRLNLYARNIGNGRGVIFATNRNGTAQPTAEFIQPRTIGFDLEYDFEHPR